MLTTLILAAALTGQIPIPDWYLKTYGEPATGSVIELDGKHYEVHWNLHRKFLVEVQPPGADRSELDRIDEWRRAEEVRIDQLQARAGARIDQLQTRVDRIDQFLTQVVLVAAALVSAISLTVVVFLTVKMLRFLSRRLFGRSSVKISRGSDPEFSS
jgi:hypothetical protein